MGASRSNAASAEAWALAGEQQGLLTRQQLLALGFSPKAIVHRVSRGRLHPVARGVYAVGWAQMTPRRRWMAAILVCGEGAVLSHRSAGALWGIAGEHGHRSDVSVPRRVRGERSLSLDQQPVRVRIHSRPALRATECTTRHGIPVTTPARTLLDLATDLGARPLERAVNEADKRDLIDPVALRAVLDGYSGVPGVRALRRLLDRDTFQLSDSALEIFFRPIAAAAGLPPPLGKRIVNGFEVDFHWPGLDLVVETDGLRYHRTPSAQVRDRIRDQAHTAAGLTQLRFTHWQVKYEPDYVERILAWTARRLQP